MSPENVEDLKKGTLRILAVIGILTSLMSLLYYYCEQYDFFISPKHHGNVYGIYIASGFRLICRMAYPVGLLGIFFYRRWAVTLLIMIWVMQISLFTIFFYSQAGVFDFDYFISLVPLVLTIALLYWCRQLFKGKILLPVVIYFLVALIAHTIIFFLTRSFS